MSSLGKRAGVGVTVEAAACIDKEEGTFCMDAAGL